MTDHYATLGVAKNATPEDIKKAYSNGLIDKFWTDKLTPVILLRRKNPRGEDVDYSFQQD
jgi:preprotein translocase subunit Sec63